MIGEDNDPWVKAWFIISLQTHTYLVLVNKQVGILSALRIYNFVMYVLCYISLGVVLHLLIFFLLLLAQWVEMISEEAFKFSF